MIILLILCCFICLFLEIHFFKKMKYGAEYSLRDFRHEENKKIKTKTLKEYFLQLLIGIIIAIFYYLFLIPLLGKLLGSIILLVLSFPVQYHFYKKYLWKCLLFSLIFGTLELLFNVTLVFAAYHEMMAGILFLIIINIICSLSYIVAAFIYSFLTLYTKIKNDYLDNKTDNYSIEKDENLVTEKENIELQNNS